MHKAPLRIGKNLLDENLTAELDAKATTQYVDGIEADRVAAENSRVTAEEARVIAEIARDAAFDIAIADANTQVDNARNIAAAAADAANDADDTNIAIQIAEEQRVLDEGSRKSAELSRVAAEQSRVNAETTRQQTFSGSETTRQQTFTTNEAARTQAFNTSQSSRQAAFDANESARDTIVADKIAELETYDQRLTTTEQDLSQHMTNYATQISDIVQPIINLFDRDTITKNGLLNGNIFYPNVNWAHSDYIPIEPGTKYVFLGENSAVCEYYDTSKMYLSTYIRTPIGVGKTVITAPPNAYFTRINIRTELVSIDNIMMVKGEVYPDSYIPYNDLKPYLKMQPVGNIFDVLNGKRIACVGDSLTEAPGYKGYANIVSDRNNMVLYNYGISGSTIANVSGRNPFTGRWNEMASALDYITLWFGWNDQEYAPLGAITDTVNTTFYGGFNDVIPKLITKYPKAKIGLIVPYLPVGKEAYQQAVRDIGEKWGLPALDLMGKNTPLIWLRNGIDSTIAQLRRSTFTYDGTHLNQDGHNYFSTFYEHFLRSL